MDGVCSNIFTYLHPQTDRQTDSFPVWEVGKKIRLLSKQLLRNGKKLVKNHIHLASDFPLLKVGAQGSSSEQAVARHWNEDRQGPDRIGRIFPSYSKLVM